MLILVKEILALELQDECLDCRGLVLESSLSLRSLVLDFSCLVLINMLQLVFLMFLSKSSFLCTQDRVISLELIAKGVGSGLTGDVWSASTGF